MPIPGLLEDDRFVPAPGSTPGNVTVIFSIVETAQQQEIRGNSLILNRTRYILGASRIQSTTPNTTLVIMTGKIRIRNPLCFLPGFQQAPLLTNTEIQTQSQRGVSGITK
jgi:hypothetical protein